MFCSLLESDKSLPSPDSPLDQKSDERFIPLKFDEHESTTVSNDCYKTRNQLLDNASVQSFEETLYLGASKPLNSSNGSKKVTDPVDETVEYNDQQKTVESEVTKIAQEW